MRRNDPKPDIPIDIGGLHTAYARGLDPAAVERELQDRHERAQCSS